MHQHETAASSVDDERRSNEELVDLEEQARPYRALYDHWERTHWTVSGIDLRTDAASFRAMPADRQQAMLWIFAHRFHAEFSVATLLAPFVMAAPTYEVQLLISTQLADEFRHMQCVLRIYEEVFGVRGGLATVKRFADEHTDSVASYFYDRFASVIGELTHDRREETFLRAIFAYHLIAEGVVARTAQNLAGSHYDQLGAFPGLKEGQRLVARDEARHIGIGVSYARQRLLDTPERSREVIARGIEEFTEIAAEGFAMVRGDLNAVVRRGYGVEASDFYGEMLRLLEVRMRSIGYEA